MSLNQVGASASIDLPEFEAFAIKAAHPRPISPSAGRSAIEEPWRHRRFLATREIGDGEHVAPLRAVQASLRREKIYRRALALADTVAAISAIVITAAISGDGAGPLMLVAAPLIAILISKVQGLYDRDDMVVQKSTVYEWRALLRADALITVATYLVWVVSTSPYPGHGVRRCALMFIALFTTSVSSRSIARRASRAVTSDELCLIVGSPIQCTGLARRLSGTPGVDLIGIVPDDDVDCSVAGVYELVEQLGVERIVVAPHPGWGERGSVKLIQSAKWLGVRVSLMPTVMTVVGAATTVDEFDSVVLLGVPRFGLSRSSAALKRALDLSVGGIALIFALPVMACVALAIKMDSPGPVLFRQTRIGRAGRAFTILKFRSMVDGADLMRSKLHERNETAGLFKIADDPRVTKVGRLLRRTYLDELPQLFNVMIGEMSLVGPRPLIEAEDSLLLGYDRHRARLTPGMTGPWQLRGPMNAALSELAKLDYMYASNWSIWADIDILMGTAARVFRRHGH